MFPVTNPDVHLEYDAGDHIGCGVTVPRWKDRELARQMEADMARRDGDDDEE